MCELSKTPSETGAGTLEVFIIRHTDWGMLTFSNDDIRAKIKADLGNAAADKVAQVCTCS